MMSLEKDKYLKQKSWIRKLIWNAWKAKTWKSFINSPVVEKILKNAVESLRIRRYSKVLGGKSWKMVQNSRDLNIKKGKNIIFQKLERLIL